MANHTGSEGTVKVGGVACAELRSFSLDITMATTEDTVIGDTATTHKVTQYSWEATVDCFWDELDTTSQGLMEVPGASLAFIFGPEGTTTGDMAYSGTGLVVGIGNKTTHNGMVECTYKIKGTGALTRAAV